MKKNLLLVLLSVLFCVFLLIVDSSKPSSFKENEILAHDINKLLKKEKTEFVVVGNENCSSCQKFDPIINKAIKKTERKIYYMNTLNSKNKSFLKNNNVNYTPTILVLEKGIIRRIEGELTYHETKKIFAEK